MDFARAQWIQVLIVQLCHTTRNDSQIEWSQNADEECENQREMVTEVFKMVRRQAIAARMIDKRGDVADAGFALRRRKGIARQRKQNGKLIGVQRSVGRQQQHPGHRRSTSHEKN